MLKLLKQIAIVGIKTEAPPRAELALLVTGERLADEILRVFGGVARDPTRGRGLV